MPAKVSMLISATLLLAASAAHAQSVGGTLGSRLSGSLNQSGQQQSSLPAESGSPRVMQNIVLPGPNSFTLSYDAGADVLSGAINGAAFTRTGFLAGVSSPDQLSIGVRGDNIAGLVNLGDLTLNGQNVGADMNGIDGSNFRFWGLDGVDFSQDFTLSGTVSLDQPYEGRGRLEFFFGGSAVPEPAAWALMIGGFGLVGAAMRFRRRRTAAA